MGRKPKKLNTILKRSLGVTPAAERLMSGKKKPGRKKKDECFISSVCFGYDSLETNTLRIWRDSFLKKTIWGIKFIKWYYKNGHSISVFLSKKKILRLATKIILLGFIKLLMVINKKI